MLLNFIKAEKREEVLVEKYAELVNSGVKPAQILVLVQNSTLKKRFTSLAFEKLNIGSVEKLNIHSFTKCK